MRDEGQWSLGRRIGFRFGFLVGALIVFPFPLGLMPGTDGIASVAEAPMRWLVEVVRSLLGAPEAYAGPNGSGDTSVAYVQMLTIAALAAVGTLVWSIWRRRDPAYPRLAAVGRVTLRYYLATYMLSYGGIKLTKGQFPDLSPSTLHARLGDLPPMRLMWAFMGYSLPYTVTAGAAEVLGGVLLFWRRTTTLGALVIIVVMTNVVLMNLCYDIPVKLLSSILLTTALVLVAPDARRLLSVALGQPAAAAASPRVPTAPRWRWARRGAKVLAIVLLAYSPARDALQQRPHDDHRHELYGNWRVDTFVLAGVEHPPLTTDRERWATLSANPRSMQIWGMAGAFEGRGVGTERGYYALVVDPFARTILVTHDAGKTQEVWRYRRPAAGELILDGVHRGQSFHVVAHLEPQGELLSRGFHWINEVPHNR